MHIGSRQYFLFLAISTIVLYTHDLTAGLTGGENWALHPSWVRRLGVLVNTPIGGDTPPLGLAASRTWQKTPRIVEGGIALTVTAVRKQPRGTLIITWILMVHTINNYYSTSEFQPPIHSRAASPFLEIGLLWFAVMWNKCPGSSLSP